MATTTSFFSIKNEFGSPVINITGEIGYDVDYTGFKNAVVDLISKGNRAIKMVINSVGGNMVDGFAMYDFIKSQNLVIEVEIIGMAASMAGVIAQCASPGMLAIHENALVMTHRPQSGSYGESDNHRVAADLSDKLETKAKAIYINRGVDATKMKDWFKPGQMKWFTAEEALASGIVDRIINSNGAKPAKSMASMSAFKDEASAYKFYNSIITHNKQDLSMNKLLVSAVLMLNNAGITNVTIDSTEDEVSAALNKFAKDNAASITNLKNQIEAHAKTRATDLVASYKAMGKLPADMKPEDEAKYAEIAEKSPENFTAMMALIPSTTPAAAPKAVVTDFNAALNQSKETKSTTADGLPTNKAEWTIRQWEQNDPVGLKNMLTNNRAEYHKLFKAFYNAEPFPLTA